MNTVSERAPINCNEQRVGYKEIQLHKSTFMIWEQMRVSQKESFVVHTEVIRTTASMKESFNIFTLSSCNKVPK